ncbi:hypothetical protein KP509_1Z051700 [Ceratopteris richardii]|nr:hypothetical protein KP509_1Z051700 [Ceratopteris richardii]
MNYNHLPREEHEYKTLLSCRLLKRAILFANILKKLETSSMATNSLSTSCISYTWEHDRKNPRRAGNLIGTSRDKTPRWQLGFADLFCIISINSRLRLDKYIRIELFISQHNESGTLK